MQHMEHTFPQYLQRQESQFVKRINEWTWESYIWSEEKGWQYQQTTLVPSLAEDYFQKFQLSTKNSFEECVQYYQKQKNKGNR